LKSLLANIIRIKSIAKKLVVKFLLSLPKKKVVPAHVKKLRSKSKPLRIYPELTRMPHLMLRMKQSSLP